MKRSKDPSRLLRPQGNRANLQRHSKAQVVLVPTPVSQALAPAEQEAQAGGSIKTAASRWRRRINTY